MAKTDAQFVDILRQIEMKKKQIEELNAQRVIDEAELNKTYQVDTVNALKSTLALDHADAVRTLMADIKTLQDSLTA